MQNVLVKDYEGNVLDGTLEKDPMFHGGWKVSYGNAISCIKIADIVDYLGFNGQKENKMKEKIDFKKFMEIEGQLEIKMGEIKNVLRIEESQNGKMLKLSVDFDEENLRTVMTNIGEKPGLSVDGEEQKLVGKTFPFVTNLKPAKMMGIESHAMIMLAENEDGTIQGIDEEIMPGAKIL